LILEDAQKYNQLYKNKYQIKKERYFSREFKDKI
jgi:hypothetical protein